jgi:hypothetical protein
MKRIIYSLLFIGLLPACKEKNKKPVQSDNPVYQRVELRGDTLNRVKLTDTLVIYTSVCRGCQYENSASFSIDDSLQLVELYNIETADNNPPDMDGGSLQKHILLVPKKTGITRFKLYSFLEQPPTAEDSTRFSEYNIEIQK